MSIFNQIKIDKVRSNTFDLSHDRKFSTKMGKLTPIFLADCIPGDRFSIKTSMFTRFAPLIAPVMHKVSAYCHFFFVPNRLVWDSWQDFITGGEDGMDNTVWPTLTVDGSGFDTVGSLADYLGLPVDRLVALGATADISSIPFAVYGKVWNDYYRDQNLNPDDVRDFLIDGNNNAPVDGKSLPRVLLNRAWQHDYFTSALPFTQKGPEAMLPLGTSAPIVYDNDAGNSQVIRNTASDALQANADFGSIGAGITADANAAGTPVNLDLADTHYADLSAATAATINQLRQAITLQQFLEKNARGGSRYNENILVQFGVHSSDKRLQRAEYLGGMSTPIQVSEVLQTSAKFNDPSVGAETPQGNMAGHAISVGSGDYTNYFCEEHGYIIGIMSIMPLSAYQEGIPRHFLRSDKFDYAWPVFGHLGEQSIQNQELWVGGGAADVNTFGYVPRYSEYKYMNSSVHGDFRTTLDFWHMGRKFATRPALNASFIGMDSSELDDRLFAVSDGTDNMWCHVFNEVKVSRKLPYFGTPGVKSI